MHLLEAVLEPRLSARYESYGLKTSDFGGGFLARWTGTPHIDAVLAGADAWRQRCFVSDGSLFTDLNLWTLDNIRELRHRFVENPIEGAERTFYDKFKEQLAGAKSEVLRLASEVIWFVLLFPMNVGVDTKIQQIKTVWEWSGSDLPESPYLKAECLAGVGNPGTAHLRGVFSK
jgi:hypothetical protein